MQSAHLTLLLYRPFVANNVAGNIFSQHMLAPKNGFVCGFWHECIMGQYSYN